MTETDSHMPMLKTFWLESRKTIALALPMIIGQMGALALSVVDRIMVGHLKEGAVEAVAAVGLDTMIVLWLFIIGMGLCSSVHVLVAQAIGPTKHKEASEVLKHGVWVCIAYTGILAVAIHLGINFLDHFGQPAEVVALAKPYVILMAWSMMPGLMFRAFRNYMEAWNNPWPPFHVTVLMVVLNVILNYMFIYGKFGAPAMGVTGAGLGTLLARWMAFIILAIMVISSKKYQLNWGLLGFFKCNWKRFKNVLQIGVPTSVQIAFEFGSISLATMMMGWLGTNVMAAQQVAQSYASFIFMVPLGMSFAVTIRVGEAMGHKNLQAVRRIGLYGTALGATFMACAAIFTFLLRGIIPHLFIEHVDVIAIVSQLLIVCALFQVWDGVQVVCMGALRGMADVKVPTIVVICSYWLVGLVVGYVLAFKFHLGGIGIWIGLLTGMIVAGTFLVVRFHKATLGTPGRPKREQALGFQGG